MKGSAMSGYIGPPLAEVRTALGAARSQFADLLRNVTDPSPPAIGTWNVGETAAHAASSGAFFLAVARGELPPEELDEVAANNAAYLAANPERSPSVLVGQFVAGETALLAYASDLEGDPPIELFAGAIVPFSTLLGVELNEILVHGYDIARASGQPWPIDRRVAAIGLGSAMCMLPYMVDARSAAGLDARFEMRIRGNGGVVFAFADGVLNLEEPGDQSVDCRLSVDPAAYLLLAYNRVTLTSQLARGKLVAWGSRPWMAMKLPTLFHTY